MSTSVPWFIQFQSPIAPNPSVKGSVVGGSITDLPPVSLLGLFTFPTLPWLASWHNYVTTQPNPDVKAPPFSFPVGSVMPFSTLQWLAVWQSYVITQRPLDIKAPPFSTSYPQQQPSIPALVASGAPPSAIALPPDISLIANLLRQPAIAPFSVIPTPPPPVTDTCILLVGDLITRILKRLDDDGTYYTPNQVLYALNIAQRLWCFMTLELEKTVTFNILANVAYYKFSSQVSDLIIPLKVTYTNFTTNVQTRLRATTLHQLNMLGPWSQTIVDVNTPTPKRYAFNGSDLLAIFPQVTSSDVVQLTYAAFPPTLIGPGDSLAVTDENVDPLIDGTIYILRLPEGQAELAHVEENFSRFLMAAQKRATYMRNKMKSQNYDMLPSDFDFYDKSWSTGAALTPVTNQTPGQQGGGGGGQKR